MSAVRLETLRKFDRGNDDFDVDLAFIQWEDRRTFPPIVSSFLFDFATILRIGTVELLKDRAFSSRITDAGKHVPLRTTWIAFGTNRRVQRSSKSSSDSPPVHASGQRVNDSRQRWKTASCAIFERLIPGLSRSRTMTRYS